MITKVLLVDDHPVFRRGLRLLLEDESDFRVVAEAGDGQQALELAGRFEPDVVVMDISMPGMDGIQATQDLLSEAPETRVIALSIHSDKAFVEGMLIAGASGYILKESVPEDIVDGIRTVCRGEVFLSAAIAGIVVDEYRAALSKLPVSTEQSKTEENIISTKLYPPRITPDILTRSQLQKVLSRGRRYILTLISAPAGYGKSTLASSWLQMSESPGAWLTLDADDNDLRIFLTYFIAALQTQFPNAFANTKKMLGISPLPPRRIILPQLLNEIENLKSDFILVLDDYHSIHEMAVHEFINDLLQYPSTKISLVIVSRGDPPLKLNLLRARGQVMEVRHKDLRFTTEETIAFMNNIMHIHMDEAEVNVLNTKTEGWVTALKLAALSLRQRDNVGAFLGELKGDSRYIQDYLTAEVVSNLTPKTQNWLLKSSILDSFNAPLCEAVCKEDHRNIEGVLSGREFLESLISTGLFVIVLDERGEWFRFQHLFQRILQNWLRVRFQQEEIIELHARASSWYAKNSMIDDAIKHALEAGDTNTAAEIVENNRHAILDDDRWYSLDKWLSMLPDEIVDQRPELLMSQAYLCVYQHTLLALLPTLEKIELILGSDESNETLLGEISYFKGYLNYFQGQGSLANEYQSRALELIPESYQVKRGEAELHYAISLHMIGEKQRALKELNSILRSETNIADSRSTRLWSGLSFIHLLEGELDQVIYPSQNCIDVALKISDAYAETYAIYIQTCVEFFQYDQENLLSGLSYLFDNRYILQRRLAVDSMCGLMLLYQLQSKENKAKEISNKLILFAQETNDPGIILIAQTCQARLVLLRGDVSSAQQLLQAADATLDSGIMLWWIEVPRITECRVLVGEGTQESLQEAVERLLAYQQENQSVQNKYQEIVILTVLAVAFYKQNDKTQAVAVLEQVLKMARPGGWIWPFIELGAPMADLLNQLKNGSVKNEIGAYIDRILAAFPAPALKTAPSHQVGLIEPLTDRELQVLKLLATTLGTDEIADELVVSVNTVRMHTKNIYGKLGAHSRIEATQIGRELDLI